ncbi:FKBP-type peptidyl-prolyl cis-trans isomerase [Actinophytocola oryzae]|uniref:FKBP-type peptidyl-prolyl cis-trans isomerase n=1 Tax=Actinophytocola oryzae TaxID=502181 RepID=UPI001414D6DD|nr:FKBP-type peptidyl-prolyl cis-trans isomerase [Actinophytocola oryzae]
MTRVVPLLLALLVLTACVSRVGPSGAAVHPSVSQAPTASPVSGECSTDDVKVTGTLEEKPAVAVPTDCKSPSRVIAADLEVGGGPQAVRGSDLDINYVMVAWSTGEELDRAGYTSNGNTQAVTNLGRSGWIHGLDEGLIGIREGGRRLVVLPPQRATSDTANPDALIFVVDAVSVRD